MKIRNLIRSLFTLTISGALLVPLTQGAENGRSSARGSDYLLAQDESSREAQSRELLRQKMERLRAQEIAQAAPVPAPVSTPTATKWSPELDAQIQQMLEEEYQKIDSGKAVNQTRRTIKPPKTVVVAPRAPNPAPAPAQPVRAAVRPAWTPEVEAQIQQLFDDAYAAQDAQPATGNTRPRVVETPTPATPAPLIQAAPQPANVAPSAAVAESARPLEEVAPVETQLPPVPPPASTARPQRKPVAEKHRPAPAVNVTATPLERSTEKRLVELLQLYKADKITPHEYHQARAKIMTPEVQLGQNRAVDQSQ